MANANHVAPQKMYGLIESSTISIEEITSLVQECFSIQLFKGLKKNEAFFIANPTGNLRLIKFSKNNKKNFLNKMKITKRLLQVYLNYMATS